MADKVPFSGIWTTFEAYIIPHHNEDISGFIFRYCIQTRQGGINPVGGGGVILIFSYIRRLGSFFGVQNFEFQ